MADSPKSPSDAKRLALPADDHTPRRPPGPPRTSPPSDHSESQRKTPIAHLSLRDALVPFRPFANISIPAASPSTPDGSPLDIVLGPTSPSSPALSPRERPPARLFTPSPVVIPDLTESVVEALLEERERTTCPRVVALSRSPHGPEDGSLPGSMPEAGPSCPPEPTQHGDSQRALSSPLPQRQANLPPTPPPSSVPSRHSSPVPDAPVRLSSPGTSGLPFTSDRISRRIAAVNRSVASAVASLTQKYLGTLASSLRLQDFRDKGEVPNTLKVKIPQPRIQSLNLCLDVQDDTVAHGIALSASLRDQLHSTAMLKTAELHTELRKAIPRMDSEDDQTDWVMKVVLFEPDSSPLLHRFPDINHTGALMVHQFNHLLSEGFTNCCLEARISMQSTFHRVVRRNKVLTRHFRTDMPMPDADAASSDPAAADTSPETLAAQIEDLRRQVASLSTDSKKKRRSRSRSRGRNRSPRRSDRNRSRSNPNVRRSARSQSRATSRPAGRRRRGRQRQRSAGPRSQARSRSGSRRPRAATPHPRQPSKNGQRGGRRVTFRPPNAPRRRSRSTSRTSRRNQRGPRNGRRSG